MYAVILALLSWYHIAYKLEGHPVDMGKKMYTAREATATTDFYVDSNTVVKIMDFMMVTADEKDTIREKKGFLIDFKKDSVYTRDFLSGERESFKLSGEWDYLAESSLLPSGTYKCKKFDIKMIDSTHAQFDISIIDRENNNALVKLHGIMELMPLNSSMMAFLTYKPDSDVSSNHLINYLAIPVTTAEAIFGEVMKQISKRIVSKGYFVKALHSKATVRGKGLFAQNMRVTSFEQLPDSSVARVVEEFFKEN